MSNLNIANDHFLGLKVDDIEISLRKFSWTDYITFVLMLTVCVAIGLYFGFYRTSSSVQEYLIGGRTMQTLPISLSLVASYISGISLLGIPTEIYVYGVQYFYIVGGFLLTTVVMNNIYLPVFHGLNLTSTYEYHERRFNKTIRLFGSLLFAIGTVCWLPLVIYVPALAFNQVTGINVHFVTPIVCLICIFYTSVGGLRAVVWTDVIQIIIMLGAIVLVATKGTIDAGGIRSVIEKNWRTDRIEAPNLDLDLFSRHTIWSLMIGGSAYATQNAGVSQSMIQRYLSLPSLNSARSASWVFFLGVFVITALCTYCGLLIYAVFHKCDPLTTLLAKEKDQLLPLLVMEMLGDIPGLPGIFVAGIFSAALSSLSTGLNSMAAVVLEDFYKPFSSKDLTENQKQWLVKATVIVFGGICLSLVFVVEKLGAVLQVTMSVGAIASGPALGLFTMGILFPWINSKGALIGGTSSLVFMAWLCLRTQTLIASGDLTFPEKPVTTEGCHYNFTPKQYFHENAENITHPDEIFMLYKLSYLWYTVIGVVVSTIVGLFVSFVTTPLDPRDIDQKLLAPFVRKLIKPRIYPNQPDDGIIYAFTPINVSSIELAVKSDSK